MTLEHLQMDREERIALTSDLRAMALAHASLDELGVPRSDDGGNRLTLFGRLEALRAGRFDPARLSSPSGSNGR